jgi:glycosyltransferase involved in cell wall biosynthesis
MLKVCHITSTDQKSIPRVLRECTTAVRMGMKPYVVALGETFEQEGISFIGVPKPKSRFYRMAITSRILYEEAVKIDADIYQVHSPELLPYALKLKKAGKIVIFDSHEFYGLQIESKEYIPRKIRKVLAKTYTMYETFVCRKLDAVIAVCTINGKDYFHNRTKRTILLENLPENFFLNDQPRHESGPNSVIYVGTISYTRGITHLVKAIHKASAKLILCGPCSSDEYLNKLKNSKEFSHVDYRGVVSKEEVLNLISTSSIGVSTLLHVGQYSEIDTLPTKVYEYMSLGKPVIISDTNYAKKMNDLYNFGVCVNPEDADEVAEKVEFLLNNPLISQKLGQNGKKAVRDKFNWRLEEEKLISLYEELLMGKAEGAFMKEVL